MSSRIIYRHAVVWNMVPDSPVAVICPCRKSPLLGGIPIFSPKNMFLDLLSPYISWFYPHFYWYRLEQDHCMRIPCFYLELPPEDRAAPPQGSQVSGTLNLSVKILCMFNYCVHLCVELYVEIIWCLHIHNILYTYTHIMSKWFKRWR